jgi:hypothetical protein
MKKFSLNWAKALMTVLMLGMIACGKDKDDPTDPNNSVPDPEGTITANIAVGTQISIIYKTSYWTYGGDIGWTGPDNFHLYGGSYRSMSICDLGTMRGLGNITAIPSTGFSTPSTNNASIACEPGHGYVVKVEQYNYSGGDMIFSMYARLYVVESIVSTTGGIMGAKVKYQYPFPTTLNLSSNYLSLPKAGGEETVEITTNASSWNYSVVPRSTGPDISWVNVTKSNNTLSISATTSNETGSYRDVYLIITAGERVQSIEVRQDN